ncbi:MAG: hypothetical protein LQ340_005207, partial [Diploschistes diacapsis]
MTAASTLPPLLTALTNSLKSASDVLPATDTLMPPSDGISLLDTKNELFLSYLHNLVFLIIIKLREAKETWSDNTATKKEKPEDDGDAFSTTVKRLVKLRVYLERGVKPLEGRLRYQIDKVVRTADEAAAKSTKPPSGTNPTKTQPTAKKSKPSASSNSSDSDASSNPSSSSSSEIQDDEEEAPSDLAYRPNPSAFTRPGQAQPRPN